MCRHDTYIYICPRPLGKKKKSGVVRCFFLLFSYIKYVRVRVGSGRPHIEERGEGAGGQGAGKGQGAGGRG